MNTQFLYSGVICLILVIIGLILGRVDTRYSGPAYRDDNPSTFWFYIGLYFGLGALFLFIGFTTKLTNTDEIDYTYYTVRADSKLSLKENLKLHSPLHQNNQIYLSYTKWYVQWSFKWRPTFSGRCRITSANVWLTAKVTLPKLVEADAVQQSEFDIYLSKLREYEQGHVDIAQNAENAIKTGLFSLPEMDSCDALNTAANDLGNHIISEYKMKQNEYDAVDVELQDGVVE